MKNLIRFLLLLALTATSARALDSKDVVMRGQGLNQVDNKGGFGNLNFNDFPDGGHPATYGAGNVYVSCDITLTNAITGLPATLEAGTWYVHIKCLDYDYGSKFEATIAGVTSSQVIMDDRDDPPAGNRWQGPAQVVTGASATQVKLGFYKQTDPSDSAAHIQLVAIYLTKTPQVYVKSTDQILVFHDPDPSEYDNGTPVKGNMIDNSGFETGYGMGWGWFLSDGRTWNIASTLDTNVFRSGSKSIRFDPFNGAENSAIQLISRVIKPRANATNSLSMYVRTTNSTAGLTIRLLNAESPPPVIAGLPAVPDYSAQITANSLGWQRVQFTFRTTTFPSPYYNVVIEKRGDIKGGPATFVDDIQLEEGEVSNYADRYGVSYGIVSDQTINPGHIYWTNDTLAATLYGYNSTGISSNLVVTQEIYDMHASMITNRTITIQTTPNSTVSTNLDITTGGRMGSFRSVTYVGTSHEQEEEWTYHIIPPPLLSSFDELASFGTQPDDENYNLDIQVKNGVKTIRGLSPITWSRWQYAEPTTPGTYVFKDANMARIVAHNLSHLMVLGENSPAWVKRQYYTITGYTGTFQVGESVTNSSGSYKMGIACILPSTSFTGDALMLTNIPGVSSSAAAAGTSLTGTTSGAVAKNSMSMFAAAPDLNRWTNYVGAMVTHYVPLGCTNYEIWNEPNQDTTEIPGSSDSPKTSLFYRELLRRAIATITNIYPSGVGIVAGGGLIDIPYSTNILFALNAAERGKLKALSIHLYKDNGPVASQFQVAMQAYPLIELWTTESGEPDNGFPNGINGNLIPNAEYVTGWQTSLRSILGHTRIPLKTLKFYAQSTGAGIRRFHHYDNRPSAGNRVQSTTYSGIEADDSLKSKMSPMAFLGAATGHGYGLGAITLSDTNCEAYVFTNGVNAGFAMIWSKSTQLRSISFSGQLTKDQYSVRDWQGNVKATNGLTVEISRYPVYIFGVSGVAADTISNAVVASTISARSDTVGPITEIALGPEGKQKLGSQNFFRAYSTDERDSPQDAEPDVIKYSHRIIGNDTNWTAFDPSATIVFQAPTSGVYRMDVKAKDSTGNEGSFASRTFTVLNADGSDPGGGGGGGGNSAPILNSIGNKSVDEGSVLGINLLASDADAGQTLTFSLDPGFPTGLQLNSGSGSTVKSNYNTITIADNTFASPYPSTINVSGIAAAITKVTVTLTNITHPFPGDIDILLQGPTGLTTWLMSDAGGDPNLSNVTLTFDDGAASFLPQTTQITSGNWLPTNFGGSEDLPSPAPAGGTYATSLTQFANTDPNGDWKLWVRDDEATDAGTIAGWYLTITAGGNTITWTPTEAQGPGTYPVTVRVTDNGSPALSDTETINITVAEVNQAPTFTQPANFVGGSLTEITYNFAGTSDPDLPSQTLSYFKDSGPAGLTISTGGHLSWTPTTNQGGANTIVARLSDNFSPAGTITRTFAITVTNSAGGGGLPQPPPAQTYYVTSVGSVAAVGSDTVTGDGSFDNPFAGDFDKILKQRVKFDKLLLREEGVYGLYGCTNFNTLSNMVDGLSIIGLNTNCILRLTDSPTPQRITALSNYNYVDEGSGPAGGGITLANFTLDCGAVTDSPTAYTYKRNGIFITGGGNIVTNIVLMRQYGRDAAGLALESFGIHVRYGSNNIIRDCIVHSNKGNYSTLFGFPGGGLMEKCYAYGNATFTIVGEKIHGYNVGGITNGTIQGCRAYQCSDGAYFDDGNSIGGIVQDNDFQNVQSGVFANMYTPTNDLPVRSIIQFIFRRNKVRFSYTPTEVYGGIFALISLPTSHNCSGIDQNWMSNIRFEDNDIGWPASPPTLGAGKKVLFMAASDVAYTNATPYPIGLTGFTIKGNKISNNQTTGPEVFVIVNQSNACVNASAKNFQIIDSTTPVSPPTIPPPQPPPVYIVPIFRPYTPFQVTA